jgi:hypothetical protein
MPLDSNALFQSALKQAQTERTQELQTESAKSAEGGNVLTGVMDAVNSAGLGILKAGIETKETAFGLMGQPEPNYEDKWPAQRAIEADAAELDRRSGVNAFVGDVSQFVTGMVGLGKFKALGMVGEVVRAGLQ